MPNVQDPPDPSNYDGEPARDAVLLDGCLCCPVCGDTYIHHAGVRVYTRTTEDQGGTITDHGLCGGISIRPHAPDEAFPRRRDSVNFTFWCEACGDLPWRLRLAQHKGNTILEWVIPKARP